MPTPLLYAMALSALLVVACAWLALRWREAVADKEALEAANEGLTAYIGEISDDAEEGRKVKAQRTAALAKAKAANAARAKG